MNLAAASSTVGDTSLHLGDFVVIAGYFVFVLSVGIWSARKNRGSAGGYFLAGRNMHWIPVGASLFASNIGSIHFVGLAGSGAASGIAIGLYELNAMYIILLLGYIFLPVYMASGVFTMPEYLKLRFGGTRIQVYLAVLALLVYIFTKISADLYAGAIFIEQSLKWDLYGAILLLLGISAFFTITGGLTAVIWTDFIQTIIMLIGAMTLMILGFIKVGGFNAMVEKYAQAIPNDTLYSNNTCGYPRDDYMHLFRDPLKADLPWPGLIGLSINSIWYWCSDQVIVQRALAGKSYDHSKAGTIFCGFLKIFPLFLLVFPGMIARILFTDIVACVDPEVCMEACGSSSGCSNIAYPLLVINLMPAGARGMMLAVMMSALMSSLTSIFNSSSTIFAMDIWTRIRRKASELEIMIVGRVFVVFLVFISVIWIPVIRASQGSELFVYIQEVSSFMQPPICAIFILGLFWNRLNEKGAFWGLVIGMIVGLIRFIVEYSYTVPPCIEGKPDPRPTIITHFHYLYFSIFLFLLTNLVAITISLLTKPIDSRCLYRLTWGTRFSTSPRLDIDELQKSYSYKSSSENDEQKKDDIEMEKVLFSDQVDTAPTVGESGDKNGEGSEALNSAEARPRGASERSLEGGDELNSKLVKQPNVEIVDKHEGVEGSHKQSPIRRIFNWVCGIEEGNKNSLSSHTVKLDDMISIKEDPTWQKISNLSAILLMVIAVFFFGFFA
ncbi:hypothetical protein ScPMuIL_009883 [Solemya velum]